MAHWGRMTAILGVSSPREQPSFEIKWDSLKAGGGQDLRQPDGGRSAPQSRSELQAALVEKRRQAVQRDKEIHEMRALLAQMERTVEHQSRVMQLDREHRSALERLASQRVGKASESANHKDPVELTQALHEDKRKLREKSIKCEELRKLVEQLEDTVAHQARVLELKGKSEGCVVEVPPRAAQKQADDDAATLKAASLEAELQALQQQLIGARRDFSSQSPIAIPREQPETKALMEQLHAEQAQRVAAENKMSELETHIQELQQCLASAGEQHRHNPSRALRQDLEKAGSTDVQTELAERAEQQAIHQRLTQTESYLQEAEAMITSETSLRTALEGTLAAQSAEIQSLRAKLMEYEGQLDAVRADVGARAEQLRETKEQQFEELSKRRCVQGQLLEKARQTCELQEQLAEEILRRERVSKQANGVTCRPLSARAWQSLDHACQASTLQGMSTAPTHVSKVQGRPVFRQCSVPHSCLPRHIRGTPRSLTSHPLPQR